MDNEVLITKKYNHMNFDLPFGNTITFGFNSFNIVLGSITMQDFQIASGIIGLIMQLTLFLTKQFYMMRNNKDPHPKGSIIDIDDHPFKRRCVGCGETFEPEHADQIFHGDTCRNTFMDNVKNRKPFIKKQQ